MVSSSSGFDMWFCHMSFTQSLPIARPDRPTLRAAILDIKNVARLLNHCRSRQYFVNMPQKRALHCKVTKIRVRQKRAGSNHLHHRRTDGRTNGPPPIEDLVPIINGLLPRGCPMNDVFLRQITIQQITGL